MEPALDERGDGNCVCGRALGEAPQWSPLSTSGATRTDYEAHCQHSIAAMEPALDERGDP